MALKFALPNCLTLNNVRNTSPYRAWRTWFCLFVLIGCENLNGFYSDAPSQPQTVALQAQRPAPGEMALSPQSLPVYDAPDAVDTGYSPRAIKPQQSAAKKKYRCGSSKRCSNISSCEEARYLLEHCGLKRLDRDGDGIPCERLCGG